MPLLEVVLPHGIPSKSPWQPSESRDRSQNLEMSVWWSIPEMRLAWLTQAGTKFNWPWSVGVGMISIENSWYYKLLITWITGSYPPFCCNEGTSSSSCLFFSRFVGFVASSNCKESEKPGTFGTGDCYFGWTLLFPTKQLKTVEICWNTGSPLRF